MFKIKTRRASQRRPTTPPTVANIVDLSILTTPTSIIESFSDDLLKQFDHKRSTIIDVPYGYEFLNEPQSVEDKSPVLEQPVEPEEVTEVLPTTPPKDIYQSVVKPIQVEADKTVDANMLALDDAFQRFINGGVTPDLTAESRTPSVASENAVINNVAGQIVSTGAKDIDTRSERSSLLRKSSSYFRSKFRKFKVVKPVDSLRKSDIADDNTSDLPSPALKSAKGNKFSLDRARSVKLSAFTQNFKNKPYRTSTQDELNPSTLEEDAQGQQLIAANIPSSTISSTLAQNTTICILQYSNTPRSPGLISSTNGSVPQGPIIAYYPPKPLIYSPVESKDESELPASYQRKKAHSTSRRISLPAVIMRNRSASHA